VTPERVAALIAWWVHRYTRGLPDAVAARRTEELAADVHDQLEEAGADRHRLAWGLLSRMLRGLPADLRWRGRQPKERAVESHLVRPVARVALGVALILAIPGLGMVFSDGVHWGVGDFVFMGVLLAAVGTVLELATKRRGTIVGSLLVAVLGVLAAVAGNADDAPGLVLIGLLLLAAAATMAARVPQRSR
jgi:hypothetical protein